MYRNSLVADVVYQMKTSERESELHRKVLQKLRLKIETSFITFIFEDAKLKPGYEKKLSNPSKNYFIQVIISSASVTKFNRK